MLAPGQENMKHENKIDSKMSSHTASGHNAKTQTGLSKQLGTLKHYRERLTQNYSLRMISSKTNFSKNSKIILID